MGWSLFATRKTNVRSGTGNDTVDKLLDQHRDYNLFSDAADQWEYDGKKFDNEYCTIFRRREAFYLDIHG